MMTTTMRLDCQSTHKLEARSSKTTDKLADEMLSIVRGSLNHNAVAGGGSFLLFLSMPCMRVLPVQANAANPNQSL